MSNLYLERLRAEAVAKIEKYQALLDERNSHIDAIKDIDAELQVTSIEQAKEDLAQIDAIIEQIEPKQVEQPLEEESAEEIAEE